MLFTVQVYVSPAFPPVTENCCVPFGSFSAAVTLIGTVFTVPVKTTLV